MSNRQTYSIRMDPNVMHQLKLTAVNANQKMPDMLESAIKMYIQNLPQPHTVLGGSEHEIRSK